MTAPRKPDRLIRAVLEEGPTVLPDRVLDSVMGEVHRTHQRAVLGPWRTLSMSMSRTALAASAIIAVVAIGGTMLYVGTRLGGVGDDASAPPSSLSSTTASGTPSSAPTANPPPSAFVATGDPTRDRSGHSATRLPDGRVLIAGGVSGEGPTNSAEIYDPRTGSFAATGSMAVPRSGQSAVLLDDGRVLIAGGARQDPSIEEIYDPVAGRFTEAGRFNADTGPITVKLVRSIDGRIIQFGPRYGDDGTRAYTLDQDPFAATGIGTVACFEIREAVAVADGRVVVICANGNPRHEEARLFDPATDTSSAVDVALGDDDGSSMVPLADGRVLFYRAGATDLILYDPDTGQTAQSGPLPFASTRLTATPLKDGRVLIVGGATSPPPFGRWATEAAVWDPRTDIFTDLPTPIAARQGQTATLLDDGRVLIVGGTHGPDQGVSRPPGAELFDPAALP